MSQLQQSEINYISALNEGKKSVIIIGAGPSGILSTKYLSQNNNVLCIEGKSGLGGLWKFDPINESNHPNLEADAYYNYYGVLQSSLYENLVCNDHKSVMCFKGLPQNRESDEFMKSEQFFQYLNTYAGMYNLEDYMAFNTFVSSVRLTCNLTEQEINETQININKKFLVELVDSSNYTKEKRYVQADFVIVCTGHYSVPNYPTIRNQQLFKGDLIHMHYFRENKVAQYANQHLLLYGVGMSAQDICYILLKKSGDLKPSRITVVGNKSMVDCLAKSEAYQEEMAKGQIVFKDGLIKEYTSPNSVVLESGELIENIDNVLYATGYQYCYPFLEANSDKDNLIEFYNSRKSAFGPLYKRQFAAREPNLIFIGAVQTAFQLQSCLERQVIIASRYIDGQITLPDKNELLSSFQEDYEETLKLHPDGRYFLKVTLSENGFNEENFMKQLQQLAQLPFDEDFEKLIRGLINPLYTRILLNGDYPNLKKISFKGIIDQDYAPKIGLF